MPNKRLEDLEREDQFRKSLALAAVVKVLSRADSQASLVNRRIILQKVIADQIAIARTRGGTLAAEYFREQTTLTKKVSKVTKAIAKSVSQQIERAVHREILSGANIKEAVKSAQPSVKASVERVITTELHQAHNQEVIRLAKKSGDNGWLVYNATLDKVTCKNCYDLDGKRYRLSEKLPEIPQHPRCRCVWDWET
jgi:SPP1 gp7 family putative phage head morphogenesis protein